MTRKLVTTAGRKQVIGRPILYKTTRDFLLRFGLKDINELPSIEEFEKMAGELAEQEEIPMEHEVPKPSPDSVTEANVDYEGSLTVDASLLEAADILQYEEVHVWNITSGKRFRTYAIAGEPGSGPDCSCRTRSRSAINGIQRDGATPSFFCKLDDDVVY